MKHTIPALFALLLACTLLALPLTAAELPVRFEYRAADATAVSLVGSFNNWNRKADPMEKKGDLFSRIINLEPGYHRYMFVVDGKYQSDPQAVEFDPGPKGSDNCMIFVGERETFSRDFSLHPVLVDLAPADRVIAIGDVHGAPEQLLGTLQTTGLAEMNNGRLSWTGKDAVLVFTGDYEDRGPDAKAVLDMIMELERLAPASGGKVIALMGNHDLWMIEGYEGWTDTRESFERAGLNFDEAMGPRGVYGSWMRNRPIAARVNGVFFCHGGLSRSWNPSALVRSVEEAIRERRWGCAELAKRESILWSRYWWSKPDIYRKALEGLHCRAVVFGHTIGAIGDKGKIRHKDGELVSIDTGMCPHYGNSQGAALEILRKGNVFQFTAHYAGGQPEELFSRELMSREEIKDLERGRRLQVLEKKMR